MKFLGAHMSVLRLQAGSGVLIHMPLAGQADGGLDLSLDLPWPLAAPLFIDGQPDVMIEPGAFPPALHITRGHQDLWADARDPMAIFRDRAEGRFEYLALADEDIAHLRALLGHRCARGPDGEGPEITIQALQGFVLDLGITTLDLRRSRPRKLEGSHSYALETDAGEITVTPIGPKREEFELKKRAPVHNPAEIGTLDQFRNGHDCWLRTQGAQEFSSLPITVCDADRDWMLSKPAAGQDHILGRHRCRPVIAHEADKYVVLSRFAEGVIFDENGVCNEDGYLDPYGYRGSTTVAEPPDGMRYDHRRLFIDRAALSRARLVRGHTIVALVGTLSNYTHWLIDCLLALHIMLDYVPAGAQVLLPGTLRAMRHDKRRIIDHHETLRVLGFSQMPTIEIDEPFCRLEHAYWLEGEAVYNMPAEAMQSFRARARRSRPGPARQDGRIYIARREVRRIANADLLEPFLERQGFSTHYLEDYSFEQQIDMFAAAEWVIGPHGAELGNLLFCQPGTKVLELAPDVDFKPFFSYMSNKLGLTHGVLACRTTDGTFAGDIILDMHKFAALFRMLKNRL